MLMKMQSSMNPIDADEGTPVSVKIRERIQASRKRFNANDNIAQFIEPGELELLLDEVEEKMKGVLSSLVIDTDNDHNTDNTARRVAKMYVQEVFKGRYVAAPTITEFPNAEHLNELMIVGPITVRSACSHHFCPVIGQIWIGVMPNEHTNVIGLSKYASTRILTRSSSDSGRRLRPSWLLTEVEMMIGTAAVRGSPLSWAEKAKPASMLVIIRSVMISRGFSCWMRSQACLGSVQPTTR